MKRKHDFFQENTPNKRPYNGPEPQIECLLLPETLNEKNLPDKDAWDRFMDLWPRLQQRAAGVRYLDECLSILLEACLGDSRGMTQEAKADYATRYILNIHHALRHKTAQKNFIDEVIQSDLLHKTLKYCILRLFHQREKNIQRIIMSNFLGTDLYTAFKGLYDDRMVDLSKERLDDIKLGLEVGHFKSFQYQIKLNLQQRNMNQRDDEDGIAFEAVVVEDNDDILDVSIPRFIDASKPSEIVITRADCLNKLISRYQQLPAKYHQKEDKAVIAFLFDRVKRIPLREHEDDVRNERNIKEVFSADNFKYQLKTVMDLVHCSREMSFSNTQAFFSFLFCIDPKKAFSFSNFDTVLFERIGLHDPDNQTQLMQDQSIQPRIRHALNFYQMLYNLSGQAKEIKPFGNPTQIPVDPYQHFMRLDLQRIGHITRKDQYLTELFECFKPCLREKNVPIIADTIFQYIVQVRRGWKKADDDFLPALMRTIKYKRPKYWVLWLLTCRLDELYQIVSCNMDNHPAKEFRDLCDDQVVLVKDKLEFLFEELSSDIRDSYIYKVKICVKDLLEAEQTLLQQFIQLHTQLSMDVRQSITKEVFLELFTVDKNSKTFSVVNFKRCLKSAKDLQDCSKQMSLLEIQVFLSFLFCQDLTKAFSWLNFDANFIKQIGLHDPMKQQQFREDESLSGLLKGALIPYLQQYNKQAAALLINQSMFNAGAPLQPNPETPVPAALWKGFS